MSTQEFTHPQHRLSAFNCPHCGAFSTHLWTQKTEFYYSHYFEDGYLASDFLVDISRCEHCKKQCLWVDEKMVNPDSGQMPLPNEDLSDDIKKIYLEAAAIQQKSHRAAAALLRLALQKLCVQLGSKGQNIREDIKILSQNGLPAGVMEAMDSVRIIGNNAVHPGHIDLQDDVGITASLFKLINFAANKTLTEPKEIKALHDSLPEEKRIKNNSEQPSS